MTETDDQLRQRFEAEGQGHLFADFDDLSASERAELLEDCRQVDFDWLAERLAQYRDAAAAAEAGPTELEPAPVIELPDTDAEYAYQERALLAGNDALRQGAVAAFMVAGGQGTRLGYDGPKGCFSVGPVGERTLFQWHAEQIKARAEVHGVSIPWYIMTSRLNDAATRAFFAEKKFFGLGEENVKFFRQRMVPSIDFDGKLLRADRSHLAMNPDGHGGCLWALVHSGAVEDMKHRGIHTISYFQVDNPLVTIADPVFLGYHLLGGAAMSSKVLEKAYPEEKVGHICLADGDLCCIEYSDMTEENMHALDPETGRLKFWSGSIAIHMLNVGFVEHIGRGARLPWHVARKKIPHYVDGAVVEPSEPNGVKFETFVFDALPFCEESVTMEVAREEEFAPVKNASGVDSVESCQQLLSDRFGRWLEAAGKVVPRDEHGHVPYKIEIAPTYALAPEDLAAKVPPSLKVDRDILLEEKPPY